MENKFKKAYIIDTNIILNDVNYIIKLSDEGTNLIILSEIVIDEIDNKKNGYDETNFQAREFARFISNANIINRTSLQTIEIVSLEVNGVYLDLITNVFDYESLSNDDKILEVMTKCDFKSYYTIPVKFLTLDSMCNFRAILKNLDSGTIHDNYSNGEYEFIKRIEIDDYEIFREINYHYDKEVIKISDIDSNHKPENFCYKVCNGDYFKLCYIKNNIIYQIDDGLFNKLYVKPLNDEQRFALALMLDTDIDINVINAIAGTGKTILAISAGIRLVQEGKYNGIVYIRNSIESLDKGEDVGYLSGNNAKFEIYNYPLFDTLNYFISKSMKKKKKDLNKFLTDGPDSKVEDMMKKYNISTIWPGSIRGRTIRESFVIIDEVQNFSCLSLQTTLSRIDDKSKVVCIGSNMQIDNMYINKYTNGLSKLLLECKKKQNLINLSGTSLNHVIRGKITEWTENVFSK